MNIATELLEEKIIRVVCTVKNEMEAPSYLISKEKEDYPVIVQREDSCKFLKFQKDGQDLLIQRAWELVPKDIYRYTIEGGKAKIITKKTVDGERAFVENAATVKVGSAYAGMIQFQIDEDEGIYGLGQQENGVFNYRNVTEYLYQNNMKIPMPVFLSSRQYAIFFDTSCLMTYEEYQNRITVSFDAVNQIDYYMITGKSFDELIQGIRSLTGKPAMLPQWAFGYIQSKERYKTQQEILETAQCFLDQNIPVSCLVLDWLSWETGKWGNKIVDKARFPNLKKMVDQLHSNNIAFMVSVWPNVSKGCDDNIEFLEAGKLLSNLSTYDAYDEEARKIYWRQCEKELFAAGTDGWWCDSTEPFTPDWSGVIKKTEEERYHLAKEALTKHFDSRDANSFALFHAKGIFENQTRVCSDKRVVNLTRSGSPSIQKYGVILWSGDIQASWEVYKKQIAEGLSMCASGMPFWTLDIGAFFVGSDRAWRRWSHGEEGQAPWFWQGLYEEGVEDLGYRELYTRWLQMGTFLPVMRSHGTDTPREPWRFGEPGTKYYDTIVKYIRLRYHLLPYIYSLAAMVVREGYTMMRSLLFDFAQDQNVKDISTEYMFGPSFLVCPVLEPMEYGPDSKKQIVEPFQEVYLPLGSEWYDYETGEIFAGGQGLHVKAPIEKLPLYVRTGAIIPVSDHLDGTPNRIEVYEGADGRFELYIDNGTDYGYELGEYALLPMEWEDRNQRFTIMDVEGKYTYPEELQVTLHKKGGGKIVKTLLYKGMRTAMTIRGG